MDAEFDNLPPELKDALARMLERASGEEGRRAAHAVIRRENEIWPLVQQVLEEACNDAGAAPAFDLLWREIKREVRATIGGALLRRREEDVDEVEQRTAIEIFRKRKEYSTQKGTFLVWVRGIARNLARWRRPSSAAHTEIDQPPVRPNQDRELPPSACFRELLSWIQEREPHHAIVFLLHDYLEWNLGSIANQLGAQTIRDLAALVVRQIRDEVRGLKDPAELFARLRMKAEALGDTKLSDLYGEKAAKEALHHWSFGAGRWLRGRVIGSGRKLLACVSALRAGAHERLTFLWSRFLRRSLGDLVLHADQPLLVILGIFRSDFPALTDLTPEEVQDCTEPLRKEIGPRTLAQCSRGNLAEDLVVWRERIQKMVAVNCKENAVAYAYLCGALPGIMGPTKGGVA